MILREIIREAGLPVGDFPNASQFPVKLFDRKNRLVQRETIQFIEPLFARNNQSKAAFSKLLAALEKLPSSTEVTARIDENMVLIYVDKIHVFSRIPALDPIDYTD